MSMTTTAHGHMHKRHCPALSACTYVKDGSDRSDCRAFDEQLRRAEKEHTQAAAQKLLHMSQEVMLVHGAAVTQGLLLAYKTVAPDPYYKESQS